MTVHLEPSAVKNVSAKDWAIRFAFGGTVTVVAGLIAHAFGPVVGGLFLAFPAILPASLTLVKENDGRVAASRDAGGAAVGALALSAFALAATATLPVVSPVAALAIATLVWMVIAFVLWVAVFGRGDRGS